MTTKRKILSLPPQDHISKMFSDELWSRVLNEFEVIENSTTKHLSVDEITNHLSDCEAIITGWGAQPFSKQHFDRASKLQLIAHTAGTVKHLFSNELISEVLKPRNISVFSGNEGLAINVAEVTIGLMIAASRRWSEHAAEFRKTKRRNADGSYNGQFLTHATVGLISASLVARKVLPLLVPFHCNVLLYDPFLSEDAIRKLGAEPASLDELFEKSDIISLHAPALPATKNMIGTKQLKKMRDGALFINTARGSIVDHDALLSECRSGRILAALDVTYPEPLPPQSEFWNLPNVLLLPHVAGQGKAGYFEIGEMTFNALQQHFEGKPFKGSISFEKWDLIA
jgi:phosphoglycerate dehydrogenase-like enzyme